MQNNYLYANYKKKLGIIGGGQLGKMIAYRASLLGFYVLVYTDSESSCAVSFADEFTVGNYNDTQNIVDFCNKCDFITSEFENISPLPLLNSKFNGFNATAMFVSQHRIREKTLAKSLSIPTPHFAAINNKQDVYNFFDKHSNCIIKTTTLGYDGKGQYIIKTKNDIEKIPNDYFKSTTNNNIDKNLQDILQKQDLDFVASQNIQSPLIAESMVNFELEFSVACTRSADGKIVFFPSCINKHVNGILKESIADTNFTNLPEIQKARYYTQQIANKINFVGTMAVEYFLTTSGEIIFNEIAPRPHNSAHYSMDLCNICQFENHVRATTGLAIISPQLLFEGKMLNIIGDEIFSLFEEYKQNPNAKIHLYGKSFDKNTNLEGRKLGHINIIEITNK